MNNTEMHLLLIDDDPNMHRLIKLMLKNSQVHLEAVSSARIALKKLKDNFYDLIISDLQMPEMDGIAFLKELRARNHKVKVIIMSAYGLQKMDDIAIASGASLVLEKPIQKEKLFKAIQQVTAKGQE